MPISDEGQSTKQRVVTASLAATIGLISLAALLFQTYLISHPSEHIYSDMNGYISRAWEIATNEPLEPFDTFFPPGTSYLYSVVFKLAGFATGLEVIAILQCLMLALSNVLFFLILRDIFCRPWAAFFATLPVAFYWPRVALASFYMSEHLFTFLLILIQYLLLKAIRKGHSLSSALNFGLLIGMASLVKGQGLALLGTYFLLLLLPQCANLRKNILGVLSGLVFVFTLHIGVNSLILGKPALFIAANDSFNAYLGQSQREAIVGVDTETGGHYVYHNNNAGFNPNLSPPTLVEAHILDRDFFQTELRKLWKEDPLRQIVRGLKNTLELFSDHLGWPVRNLDSSRESNQRIKTVSSFLLWPLALLGFIFCFSQKQLRWIGLYLGLPLIGVAAISFISMGQPRYLIPFIHNALGLSLAAFLALIGKLDFSKDLHSPLEVEPTSTMRQKLLSAVIIFLLTLGFLYLRPLTSADSKAISSNAQVTYRQMLISKKNVLAWFELNNSSEQFTNHNAIQPLDNTSISLEGFWPLAWDDQRTDHPRHQGQIAEQKASIVFSYPRTHRSRHLVTGVSLYVLDIDSSSRVALAQSDSIKLFVDSFRNGKWIFFPISPRERFRGEKRIDLEPIIGFGVPVLAATIHGREL